MRTEIMEYLQEKKDLKEFIRQQPIWYRKLGRNPHDLQSFEVASLHYFRKTIPDHVEKFSNSVQMASMMMHMFQAMNQTE
ncbi:YlbE-like family protein [Neobacillus sp. D3-1R]|uniref:YlbE-like family protein n=1 Tax=Neobacillus sp. D3-1R TaxID=3445778 RepID=UPI003FA162F0